MDKFVIRTKRSLVGSSSTPIEPLCEDDIVNSSEKRAKMGTNPLCEEDDIISDPGLRKCINEHEPRIRDEIRRKYVQWVFVNQFLMFIRSLNLWIE
jgi:hypothetical protein